MAIEIERKFLVEGESWRATATGKVLRQGYLCDHDHTSVRVRIAGSNAYLTVKSGRTGATRAEFEYSIPLDEAAAMLDTLCARPLIEKTRFTLTHGMHVWVVDVFDGDNAGLIVAEVELNDENEDFERPDWLGAEVTDDPRYLNANLVRMPYRTWSTA